MKRFLLLLLLMLASAEQLHSAIAMNAQAIIENTVEAKECDWQVAPGYSYTETIRDANGSKTMHAGKDGGILRQIQKAACREQHTPI